MNKKDKTEKNNNEKFEDIKYIDENGIEYWNARELQKVLQYARWEKFLNVIEKAKKACENSGNTVIEHFPQVEKLSKRANNAVVEIIDYKLSRYACYLIVQNSDPNKEVVALGQTYFAIQTRKQEISEKEYELLSEDEKRFYHRKEIKFGNYTLQRTAQKAGVKNLNKFHNAGYKGLYKGETADDIAKRKGLRYREEILDNMGSDELIANQFRISQTNQKLTNENIKGESSVNKAHYAVGKAVRDTIKKVGGTMPEELPTPKKSLKELEKVKKKLGESREKKKIE